MKFFVGFLLIIGKIFCFFNNELLFKNLLYSNKNLISLNNSFSNQVKKDIDFRFFFLLLKFFNDTLYDLNENKYISEDCFNDFNKYVNNEDEKIRNYFIYKLLLDSSQNKNDLSAFDDCMARKYKLINDSESLNSTFFVLSLDKTGDYSYEKYTTSFETNWYLAAFCLINNNKCSENEIVEIIKAFDRNFSGVFDLDNSTYQLFIMNKNEKDIYKNIYFNFIPLIIIIIIILFSFFPKSLIKIFNCCFKKENLKIDDDDDEIENVSVKNLNERKLYPEKLIELKNCFLFKQNFWEIFNLKKMTTDFNNFNGLFYIRGLIGISMIFLIFGFTFFALINSPVKIYGQVYFFEIITSLFFILFFIGLRYSPRVLFSCSGYFLFHKMVGFFEDSEKNLKTFFIFIFYQFHKYFMLILFSFFCRFSLFKIIYLLIQRNPMWRYFNKMLLIQPNLLKFFLSFSGFYNFITINNNKRDGQNILDYFWMIYNEIFFFIFGSILIFIGIKYKKRIDIFIIIFFLINVILKIVFSYYHHNIFNLNKTHVYYSTLYYLSIDYGKFMQNPLFNLPYYLIGIFFGSMNYIIQKGIESEYKIDEDNKKIFSQEIITKPFLKLPLKITNIQRNIKKITHFLFAFIFVINVILCSIPFIWRYFTNYGFDDLLGNENIPEIDDKKGHLKEFLKNSFINFIYRIDIEIFVISIHWILFAYYLRGNYLITDFFGNIFWNILNKIYFTFILLCNIVILYVLYQSETNIYIVLYNIVLYGFISGFIIIILSLFFYITFELPLKRLIKFIVKNIIKNNVNFDDIEEDIILNKSDSNVQIENEN